MHGVGLSVHHIDEVAVRGDLHAGLGDENGADEHVAVHEDAHILAGHDGAVPVGEGGPGADDAGGGLHLGVNEVHHSLPVVHAAVQQAQTRRVDAAVGGLETSLALHGLALHAFRRGDGEVDEHGIGLVHRGEQGVVGHEVAGRDGFLGGEAGDRSLHLAVVQVDLRPAHGGLGALVGGERRVALLLGDGVGLVEGPHALPFALGVHEGRLGFIVGGLVLIALQLEHDLAGPDEIAFLVEALLDDPLHPGPHIHGPGTGGRGLVLGRPGHIAQGDVGHDHIGWGLRAPGLFLAVAGGKTQSQDQNTEEGKTISHAGTLHRFSHLPVWRNRRVAVENPLHHRSGAMAIFPRSGKTLFSEGKSRPCNHVGKSVNLPESLRKFFTQKIREAWEVEFLVRCTACVKPAGSHEKTGPVQSAGRV